MATAKKLADWYAELAEKDNGYTTLAERQGKVNQAVLQGSPTLSSDLDDYFINSPKPKSKKIDMSVCIESGVDCEFAPSHSEIWIGSLTNIKYTPKLHHYDKQGNSATECRVRQDHWIFNEWDTCPIPEGLKVTLKFKHQGQETTSSYRSYAGWGNDCDYDIIAFKVLGVAEGYSYE